MKFYDLTTPMVLSAGHRPAIFLRIIATVIIAIGLTGCVFSQEKEDTAKGSDAYIPLPKKMTAAATLGCGGCIYGTGLSPQGYER